MVVELLTVGRTPEMIAQREDLQQAMTEDRTIQAVPVSAADDHLNHLLLTETQTPWIKSLVNNIKDLINPPKLPPLQVTSKPVPVKEIWGSSKNTGTAGVSSLAVHVGLIALLMAVSMNKTVQDKAREVVTLIAPTDLSPYVPAPDKLRCHTLNSERHGQPEDQPGNKGKTNRKTPGHIKRCEIETLRV